MKQALKEQIIKDVEALSEDKQNQVALFIQSLKKSNSTKSLSGKEAISHFAGALDKTSAQEMLSIIEEGCEVISAEGW
jgi:hypothetical protein